jgi:hypothetical protein
VHVIEVSGKTVRSCGATDDPCPAWWGPVAERTQIAGDRVASANGLGTPAKPSAESGMIPRSVATLASRRKRAASRKGALELTGLINATLVRSFHRRDRVALDNVDQRRGKVREPLGKESG